MPRLAEQFIRPASANYLSKPNCSAAGTSASGFDEVFSSMNWAHYTRSVGCSPINDHVSPFPLAFLDEARKELEDCPETNISLLTDGDDCNTSALSAIKHFGALCFSESNGDDTFSTCGDDCRCDRDLLKSCTTNTTLTNTTDGDSIIRSDDYYVNCNLSNLYFGTGVSFDAIQSPTFDSIAFFGCSPIARSGNPLNQALADTPFSENPYLPAAVSCLADL